MKTSKKTADAARVGSTNGSADWLQDYYRLNYIENLYSSGDQRARNEFMLLACERGFRRAADMKRLSPNRSG